MPNMRKNIHIKRKKTRKQSSKFNAKTQKTHKKTNKKTHKKIHKKKKSKGKSKEEKKKIKKSKNTKKKYKKHMKKRMKKGGRLTPEEKIEMQIGRPDNCDFEQSTECINNLLDSLERNNINIHALSIAQLGLLSDRPNESYEDFVQRFASIPDEKRKREYILDKLHNMVYNDPNIDRSCLECPFIEDLNIPNPTGSKIDAIIIRHFPFLNPYPGQQSSFNFESPTTRPDLRQGAYISDNDSLFESDDDESIDTLIQRSRHLRARMNEEDGDITPTDSSPDTMGLSAFLDNDGYSRAPNIERQATIGTNLMDRFDEVDNNSENNTNDLSN